MKKSNEVFNQKTLNFKQFTLPQLVHTLLFTFILFIIECVGLNCFAQESRLRIHFIDVGYGDAILIQFPDSKTMMIDAGEKPYAPRLIEYLQSLNIQKIDQAVITHPHKNHFEGFFDILELIPIHQLFINDDQNVEEGYEELLEAFHRAQVPVQSLKRGMKISGLPETVEIQVLHPQSLLSNANDNSIVLWLKHQEISVLLMADIELQGQEELISSYQEIRQVNSIKIPHHGGPLSDKFIQSFTDKNFIISTGLNPWGLPYEYDLQKLQGTIYRTDHQGTIILESDGASVLIQTVGVKRN